MKPAARPLMISAWACTEGLIRYCNELLLCSAAVSPTESLSYDEFREGGRARPKLKMVNSTHGDGVGAGLSGVPGPTSKAWWRIRSRGTQAMGFLSPTTGHGTAFQVFRRHHNACECR